jgi:hypothetical protein
VSELDTAVEYIVRRCLLGYSPTQQVVFCHEDLENFARRAVEAALRQVRADELADRDKRIAALELALISFGQHYIGCPGWHRYHDTDNDTPSADPCDCGLHEAIVGKAGDK